MIKKNEKRRNIEVAKSLKICIHGREIGDKEKYCFTEDIQGIIILLQSFYVYIQNVVFLVCLGNKLQLSLTWSSYP